MNISNGVSTKSALHRQALNVSIERQSANARFQQQPELNVEQQRYHNKYPADMTLSRKQSGGAIAAV